MCTARRIVHVYGEGHSTCVRRGAVNAVIEDCCNKDLTPVELIAQHFKIAVITRMQQRYRLRRALY